MSMTLLVRALQGDEAALDAMADLYPPSRAPVERTRCRLADLPSRIALLTGDKVLAAEVEREMRLAFAELLLGSMTASERAN